MGRKDRLDGMICMRSWGFIPQSEGATKGFVVSEPIRITEFNSWQQQGEERHGSQEEVTALIQVKEGGNLIQGTRNMMEGSDTRDFMETELVRLSK